MKELNKFFLESLDDSKLLAEKIAKFAKRSFVICLHGDLGSGKTTFARYFINTLSKKKHNVQSPTFPMVYTYESTKFTIWHFDLYRLSLPQEVFNLDYELALDDIVIIEWPNIIQEYLPPNRVEIFFSEDLALRRFATVRFCGNLGGLSFNNNE